MKPFDYVNAINFTKEDIIDNSDNPSLAEKLYPAYLVNKSLSQFVDTIKLANEMNINHHIDKKLQFDFLINTVRSKKRYSKWAKKEEIGDIELVMSHYGYSYDKARQVLLILTPEQIEIIKRIKFEGGLNGN